MIDEQRSPHVGLFCRVFFFGLFFFFFFFFKSRRLAEMGMGGGGCLRNGKEEKRVFQRLVIYDL